jgi:hypothetical protein
VAAALTQRVKVLQEENDELYEILKSGETGKLKEDVRSLRRLTQKLEGALKGMWNTSKLGLSRIFLTGLFDAEAHQVIESLSWVFRPSVGYEKELILLSARSSKNPRLQCSPMGAEILLKILASLQSLLS